MKDLPQLPADEATQNKEWLAHLLQSVPAIIYTANPAGAFAPTFVSENVYAVTGYAPRAFTTHARFWAERIHPEDAPRVFEGLPQLLKNGAHECEYRWRVADGSYKWFTDSVRLVTAARGRPAHLVGGWQDVTERKQAELALQENEERFRQMAENINEVFWLANADLTKLLYVSPMFDILWGRSRQCLYDNPRAWLESIHPEDRQRVHQLFIHQRADRGEFRAEYRIMRPDGSERWISDTGFVIRDAGGKIHRVAGIARDITELKQADAKIRTLSQGLIAARENERRQVASDLHHDVGSLSVGVSSHLNALEADLRSGNRAHALRCLQRTRTLFGKSVARLKDLAIQLRPPELEILGLHATLRRHCADLSNHGGARISFRDTARRTPISDDTATILFRVAQEALTNALRHGQAKRVDVRLAASNARISLSVRDNGKGYDPSAVVARATAPLGLLVMQEMVASAGGAFTLDSRPGNGTTVRVSLPFQPAATQPGAFPARKAPGARGKPARPAARGAQPPKRRHP